MQVCGRVLPTRWCFNTDASNAKLLIVRAGASPLAAHAETQPADMPPLDLSQQQQPTAPAAASAAAASSSWVSFDAGGDEVCIPLLAIPTLNCATEPDFT